MTPDNLVAETGHVNPAHAVTALTEASRAAEQTDRDIHAAITGGFQAESVTL